jgi:hypothetical protein
MMHSKLTYANVVSTLCLFLLLGGGAAYARSHLPKNSVGSKQIKKNAVNSAKVKNRSLRAVDFKEGQLPAGPQGIQGAKGDQGAPGATSVIARRVVKANVTNGSQSTESVNCDEGEALVGGGAGFVEPGTDLYDFPAKLHGSVPIGANGKVVVDAGEAFGWRASATNETGSTRDFVVIALCASP